LPETTNTSERYSMMAIGERGRVYEITNLFVLNFDTHPIFIEQETSNVARLEPNPQTDKKTGNATR